MADRQRYEQFAKTPEALALLEVIKNAEGTAGRKNPYATLFGGEQISDLSRHPDIVVRTPRYSSSAAGAYQFLTPTWKSSSEQLGLKDFGPKSQDLAALLLADRRLGGLGGLEVLKKEGLSNRVLNALAPEWASLPTLSGASYHGQPVKKAENLRKIYSQYVTNAPSVSSENVVNSSILDVPRTTSANSVDNSAFNANLNAIRKIITESLVNETRSFINPPTSGVSAARDYLMSTPVDFDTAYEDLEKSVYSSSLPRRGSSLGGLKGIINSVLALDALSKVKAPQVAATTPGTQTPAPSVSGDQPSQGPLGLGKILDPAVDPLPTTGPHLHVEAEFTGKDGKTRLVNIPTEARTALSNLYYGDTPLFRMAGDTYVPTATITSSFGSPRPYGGHTGTDFGLPVGTPITWRGPGRLAGDNVILYKDPGGEYRITVKHTG